ncbi:MBL fold metallo-hydrolase [Bacillus solimangrovi]|uniref:Hydrolase glyoxylase n=1 Tax=Bacillus solimangrovi TaxID=1305675 RepID=A0A1E5LE22_9BACI|nr:MBL fold metallo-hydrolase [Bacillus solimangrovi]OEH92341.1 hydrolase glyoxylase [Bacillus solimangrovi]
MIQYEKNNITVFQSVLYMTTSAIIQTADIMIMTDPNWLPSEVETIRKFVEENKGDKQVYIIYTHSDYDHIIGSGAFPDAKVIATDQFNNNPRKEEIVKKIHKFDYEYYLHRDYQVEYPIVDIVVSSDGQKLDLGDITITFYKAPGHTDDSLFTVIEPYGIFLSGDYLSDVEFPFIYTSYKDYVHTIEKAERISDNHQINVLIPGHGNTTDESHEIKSRIDFSKYYLTQLHVSDEDLETQLHEKYPFYEGMKNAHNENIKMAIREVGK